MSVLGDAIKLVFCEGDRDSLDKRLLNRMLAGKPPTTAIEPAGGKHQLRAFIRGRLAVEKGPSNYLAFRDRDFDARPPETIELIQYRSGQPIYMSYRAAIENYLLDAELIHRYWDENASAPSWKHGGSPGVEDILSWMDEVAESLTSYQAVRWSLAELKPSERWPEVATTWTGGSGMLPASIEKAACLAEAQKLVAEFSGTAAKVTVDSLMENFDWFQRHFSSSEFVDGRNYVVWFHGKDLKKGMQKLRQNAISLRHFSNWAVERLDWTQHADLQQLAMII